MSIRAVSHNGQTTVDLSLEKDTVAIRRIGPAIRLQVWTSGQPGPEERIILTPAEARELATVLHSEADMAERAAPTTGPV